jgi:hypothetical protein
MDSALAEYRSRFLMGAQQLGNKQTVHGGRVSVIDKWS